MTSLSVITLTFNNESELRSTYESIKFLIDKKHIEWIVIDGGQCANSVDLMKSINRTNIIYVHEEDDGIYDAFNKGIKVATKDYILFLNSGDLLADKDYFQQAISKLDDNPKIGFVHSNIFFTDQYAGNIILKHKNRPLGSGMPFFHQTLVVRKSLFQEVGMFDLDYKIAGDYDWALRLIKKGIRGQYIDAETVTMDGKGISSTNEELSIRESFKSLHKNQLLNLVNVFAIANRYMRFKMRVLLIKLGLENLLIKIKRNKI